MKITNEQLRQIIKEELEAVMNESPLQWVLNQKRKQNMQKIPPAPEETSEPSGRDTGDSEWRSQYLDKQADMEYSRRSAALPQEVYDILKPQGLNVQLQDGELVAKVLDPDRPGKKFMMRIQLDPRSSVEQNAQDAVEQIRQTDPKATNLRQGKKAATIDIADPFMEGKRRKQ